MSFFTMQADEVKLMADYAILTALVMTGGVVGTFKND